MIETVGMSILLSLPVIMQVTNLVLNVLSEYLQGWFICRDGLYQPTKSRETFPIPRIVIESIFKFGALIA